MSNEDNTRRSVISTENFAALYAETYKAKGGYGELAAAVSVKTGKKIDEAWVAQKTSILRKRFRNEGKILPTLPGVSHTGRGKMNVTKLFGLFDDLADVPAKKVEAKEAPKAVASKATPKKGASARKSV